MAEPNENLSQEELKRQKQEKIRKNFRIIALLVACYYFISAGFSWYEEWQREKAAEEAGIPELVFTGPAFRESFNNALATFDTALPTANANDNVEGFVSVLSPSIELRGTASYDGTNLESVQIQSRFPDGLEPEAYTAIQSFVHACEGTDMYTEEILKQMGIVEEKLLNKDAVYDFVVVQSPRFHYETGFSQGPLCELTIKAVPR